MKSRKVLISLLMLLYCLFAFGQAQQKMDMSQTLSDGAQSHQIAFDGLGFISGNFCACSFVPPGKVADYFGFQYMRDNDITGMGHNSDFSGIVGNNLLYILDSAQKSLIIKTAIEQENIIQQYARLRLPLIDAFVRLKDKSYPTGSAGLDSAAIKAYSSDLYHTDATVCIKRAQVYASIINALTVKQKRYLDSLFALGARNMPVLPLQIDIKPLNNNQFVGAMSIADDIYSWYVGNIDADVYFCPERQANYFGSFYLKDAPAMGNPNYSIDTSLSQSGGARFLNTLDQTQRDLVSSLTNKQKPAMAAIVDRRTQISQMLRGYLSGTAVDTNLIISLSEEYGEYDGAISYYYATNFSQVNWTLTSVQMDTLMKIRNLDDYPCTGAYAYSDKITMPTIENTDFMFLKAGTGVDVISSASGCFPNPFTSTLNVKNKSNEAVYELVDIRGVMLWKGTHINQHDFSYLPKGVYFVTTQDASEKETCFFIKK